jgi:hypothetical protein
VIAEKDTGQQMTEYGDVESVSGVSIAGEEVGGDMAPERRRCNARLVLEAKTSNEKLPYLYFVFRHPHDLQRDDVCQLRSEGLP